MPHGGKNSHPYGHPCQSQKTRDGRKAAREHQRQIVREHQDKHHAPFNEKDHDYFKDKK